jgi:hypothetical protein
MKSGVSARSLDPARIQENGSRLSRIGSGETGGSMASPLVSNWVVPGKRKPG